MAIKIGKMAPKFSLLGSDSETHTLADYKGSSVILYFYPRDNTPGCTKQACGFRDLARSFKKENIIVLGVSRDSISSHNSFIEKFKLPFVLLSDPDHLTMKEYEAWGKKVMYGKIVEGTIRSTVLIGPDGKVLHHWAKVKDAAAHAEQVLNYLRGESKAASTMTRKKASNI